MGNSDNKDDALYSAVYAGDFSQFCRLLPGKRPFEPLRTSPTSESESSPTILHLLCRYARLSMLQTLFSIYPQPPLDIRDDFGDTPLIAAVKGGHSAIVSVLLAHGADANVRNPLDSGDFPLHYAAWRGDIPTAKALLAANARINVENDLKMTPVMYAAQQKQGDMCKYLLACGGEGRGRDIRGKSAVDYAKGAGGEEGLREWQDWGKELLWEETLAGEGGEAGEAGKEGGHRAHSTTLEISISERVLTDIPGDRGDDREGRVGKGLLDCLWGGRGS